MAIDFICKKMDAAIVFHSNLRLKTDFLLPAVAIILQDMNSIKKS